MERFDVDPGDYNIGRDEKGRFVRVSDVIEALKNINTTCGDRAYEDVQELIDELS